MFHGELHESIPGRRTPTDASTKLLARALGLEQQIGFNIFAPNSDTLGWIIRRVTGQSLAQLLSQRIWSRLGAEHDAYITVDTEGTEFAGGGLNTCLRDLARFGELMRNDGWAMGQQVIPKAVIDDIRKGADPLKFAPAGYHTLPGWSYRNMWWVSHNSHGAYMARGIHGQAIYIDPMAQMVIARYASHHIAGNLGIDPHSLPAYHAMALHLMKTVGTDRLAASGDDLGGRDEYAATTVGKFGAEAVVGIDAGDVSCGLLAVTHAVRPQVKSAAIAGAGARQLSGSSTHGLSEAICSIRVRTQC